MNIMRFKTSLQMLVHEYNVRQQEKWEQDNTTLLDNCKENMLSLAKQGLKTYEEKYVFNNEADLRHFVNYWENESFNVDVTKMDESKKQYVIIRITW